MRTAREIQQEVPEEEDVPFLFFRERDRFSEDVLRKQLPQEMMDFSEQILRDLRFRLAVPLKKKRQKNEFADVGGQESEDDDEDENSETATVTGNGDYYFEFTGIQEYHFSHELPNADGQNENLEKNFLICCVPKYFDFSPNDLGKDHVQKIKNHLKTVLHVLQKYGRNKDQNDISSGVNPEEERSGSLLALEISLIQSYLEEGSYTNTEVRYERNGHGDIDWQKTIDTALPVLQDEQPFYVNYFTRERRTNADLQITHLHECIVSECSRNLKANGVADFLDLEIPEPYEGALEDFGESEIQQSIIDRELSVQFITSKQNLLKMMKAFITQRENLSPEFNLQMFGTEKFENVWEKVIGSVFGDQNETPIPGQIKEKWKEPWEDQDEIKKYRDVMPYPVITLDKDEKKKLHPSQTQKTDFVKLEAVSGKPCDERADNIFYVLDAKYYVPDFPTGNDMGKEGKIGTAYGFPGVQDVNKQHLYQVAYRPLIRANKWKSCNAFLMPKFNPERVQTESPTLDNAEGEKKKMGFRFGEVKNPIFGSMDGIQPIQLVYIDPDMLYDAYLHGNYGLSVQDSIEG